MTTDDFIEAARAEAERRWSRDQADGRPLPGYARSSRRIGFEIGALWARAHLAAQEESVLMTSREETISDRLSDAGYTEYAEDEDGGVTWVSAPLGEVLRIVSAAQEPTQGEVLDLIEDRLHDAGVTGIAETSDGEIVTTVDATMAEVLTAACAALSAARAARRDEEKR